jgi:hypothetical protein
MNEEEFNGFAKAVGAAVALVISLAWVAMLVVACVIVVFVFGVSQSYAGEYEDDVTDVWSVIPGTRTPGRLDAIIKGDTIYPVIPGTRTPDYGSKNRHIIRGGTVYRAIPGTNTPAYGKRSYRVR